VDLQQLAIHRHALNSALVLCLVVDGFLQPDDCSPAEREKVARLHLLLLWHHI